MWSAAGGMREVTAQDRPLAQFLFGSGLLFITRAGTALLLLFINVILARQMPLGDVGIFLFFYTLSVLVGSLITLGTGTAALRFVSEARDAGDYAAAAQVGARAAGLMLVLAGAFLVLAGLAFATGATPWLSRFPGLADWGFHALLWVAAVAIRMNAFDILIAQDRPGLAALHSGFGAAATTALVLLGALAIGVEITIGLVLGAATLAAVLSAISAQGNALRCGRRDINAAEPRSSDPVPGFCALLRVGAPIAFSKTLSSRRKELLVVVLGAVASAEAVALLGLANQVIQVIAMPMVAVTALIQPQIARAGRDGGLAANMPRIRTLWSVALAPVIVIAVVVALLAEPLAVLAYGPSYADIGVLLMALILGSLVAVAAGPTTQTLMMTGHEKALALLSLLESIPLVFLGLALGARFGALGGAWAFTLSVLLVSVIHIVYIRRLLGLWVFAWVFPTSLH